MRGFKHPKQTIADTLELCIGNNESPTDAAKMLNLPLPTICDWMSLYWFYRKINNPVILTFKSNV